MKLRYLIISCLILFSTQTFAQNSVLSKGKAHKGQFFFYWGYNRSSYTNSDIHFKGPEYDFTLRDVKAKDRQSKFTIKNYFSITRIWVPQYNYRLGFWLKNDLSISFGLDHMKYNMVQNQTVKIDGYINPRGNYTKHSKFNNDDIELTRDFLRFEHTDGLNYFSFELEKLFATWTIVPEKVEVSLVGDIGLGVYIPRSDVHLFGVGLNNNYHLGGWGASMMAGVHIEFWRKVFIRWSFKSGYTDLPSILTTGTSYDRASQHFLFNEMYGVIGMNFFVFKNKDKEIKKDL